MIGKWITVFILILSACTKPNFQKNSNDLDKLNYAESACVLAFTKSQVCGTVKWQKIPTETETGSFLVKIYPLNNSDENLMVFNYDLKIYLWMPSMGHGSSPVQVNKIADNNFLVEKVFFIMPGDWEIHYKLMSQGIEIDEFIQQIRI